MKFVALGGALICAVVGLPHAPANARFLQVDPVGYDDQINLYTYVGNDPVNSRDPDGKCRNRDDAGECVVTNRAGAEGAKAASQLQTQVRRVDHAIKDLDPKQKVKVDVGGGKTREMTGAQVTKAWAKTDWAVDPNGTKYDNGLGAQIDNGRFSGTSEYLQSFRDSARGFGRNEDEATRSVVLHDFGHSTKVGRGIMGMYPGSGLDNFNSRERATSRLGQSIGNAIGETFECQTFGTGC